MSLLTLLESFLEYLRALTFDAPLKPLPLPALFLFRSWIFCEGTKLNRSELEAECVFKPKRINRKNTTYGAQTFLFVSIYAIYLPALLNVQKNLSLLSA